MRRLVQHAALGAGFTAVVVSAAVAGLGSPAVQSAAVAVPLVSVSAPVAAPTVQDVAAERAAREAEASRSATRARLEAASHQAGRRAAALDQQSRAIAAQRAKIEAEAKAKAVAARKAAAEAKVRAAAAAKAKAAKAKADAAAAAAAKKRVAAQGYEPGTTNPREMARQILQNKYGYGANQFSCFNNIIIRESNWDIHATNAASGAYGIPQALPGTKMASVASDWRTNPATQIIWGVQYMKSRYGSPCGAWGFKSSHGWY